MDEYTICTWESENDPVAFKTKGQGLESSLQFPFKVGYQIKIFHKYFKMLGEDLRTKKESRIMSPLENGL